MRASRRSSDEDQTGLSRQSRIETSPVIGGGPHADAGSSFGPVLAAKVSTTSVADLRRRQAAT